MSISNSLQEVDRLYQNIQDSLLTNEKTVISGAIMQAKKDLDIRKLARAILTCSPDVYETLYPVMESHIQDVKEPIISLEDTKNSCL